MPPIVGKGSVFDGIGGEFVGDDLWWGGMLEISGQCVHEMDWLSRHTFTSRDENLCFMLAD